MGHHFVPQRYLRAFQDPTALGNIWMYDKQKLTVNRLPIKQVAQAPGFYSEEVESALNLDVEIPGTMSSTKSAGARSSPTTTEPILRTKHRDHDSSGSTGQGSRGEVDATALEEVTAKYRDICRTGFAEGKIDQARLEAYLAEIDQVEAKLQVNPPEEVIRAIEVPWPFETMLKAIHGMYWRFLRSEGPSYFLTSDNPVHFFYGYGLGNPKCELILPLSPDLLFYAGWQECHEMIVETVKQSLVKEFNRRTVVEAHRFIFSHENVEWVFEVAKNRPEQLNRINWVPAKRRQ